MKIEFTTPIHPVDNYSQRAFVMILNIILLSGNVVELNRNLIVNNDNPQYRKLSGYFQWTFNDYRFTLWQRTEFASSVCFNDKILELHFGSLVSQDLINSNKITN